MKIDFIKTKIVLQQETIEAGKDFDVIKMINSIHLTSAIVNGALQLKKYIINLLNFN